MAVSYPIKRCLLDLALQDFYSLAPPHLYSLCKILYAVSWSLLFHVILWVKSSSLCLYSLKPYHSRHIINAAPPAFAMNLNLWTPHLSTLACPSSFSFSPLPHPSTEFHTWLFSPMIHLLVGLGLSSLHIPCPSLCGCHLLAQCIDSKNPTCSYLF